MATRDGEIAVPRAPASVAERYRRVANASSVVFALAAIAPVVAVYVWRDSLVALLLTGLVVLAAVRIPFYRVERRTVLATDEDPSSVSESFHTPTPPILVFQWGGADAVRATDDGAVYEVSHMFGLVTVDMEVAVESLPADAAADLELRLSVDGTPWTTYTLSIRETDEATAAGETVVTVESTTHRRFAVRRLPHLAVALRYYDRAMAELGYTVRERETDFRV